MMTLPSTTVMVLGVHKNNANNRSESVLDDREGLRRILRSGFIKGLCRIRKLWVDAGYVSSAN